MKLVKVVLFVLGFSSCLTQVEKKVISQNEAIFLQPDCKERTRYFSANKDFEVRWKQFRVYNSALENDSIYYIETSCVKRYTDSIRLYEEVIYKNEKGEISEIYQKKEFTKFVNLYTNECLSFRKGLAIKLLNSSQDWDYSPVYRSEWLVRRNRLQRDSVFLTMNDDRELCGTAESEILEEDFPEISFERVGSIQVDSILESWGVFF